MADRVLSLAEGASTKRFVVPGPRSEGNEGPPSRWQFWVLTTDFYFCSASAGNVASEENSPREQKGTQSLNSTAQDLPGEELHEPTFSPNQATRACKILYQAAPPKADARKEEDELELPSDLLPVLWSCLSANSKLLPQSARKMGEWSVSLLRRFDLSDIDPGQFQVLMERKQEEERKWDEELTEKRREREAAEKSRQQENERSAETMRGLYESVE